MLRFKKIRVLSSVGSEPLGSPAWLAVPTVLVFGLALLLSWAGPLRAGCPSAGTNWCMWNGGNPCSSGPYTCVPSGPGYTCYQNNKPYVKGYYSITSIITPWMLCTSPATFPTYSCTYSQPSCGTTQFYPTGDIYCHSRCYNAGWYWAACQGSGNPC